MNKNSTIKPIETSQPIVIIKFYFLCQKDGFSFELKGGTENGGRSRNYF